MTKVKYITHAVTLDQLRQEFLSDIERRIDNEQHRMRVMKPSAVESSRIARVIAELQDLQDFWQQITIAKDSHGC